MSVQICPICEEPIPEKSEYGYRENGVWRPSCKDCQGALMNLMLEQELKKHGRGDPRFLLREYLGIKGKYQEVPARDET